MIVKSGDTFKNVRVDHTANSSLGVLSHNGKRIGFVIEDEPRSEKLAGETRIPAGKYKLGIRKDITPLTAKYRGKHPWFRFFIELLNVPNFTGIYIHPIKNEKDTAGCQGICKTLVINNGEFESETWLDSVDFFIQFYKDVYPVLEAGGEIFYEVIDND